MNTTKTIECRIHGGYWHLDAITFDGKVATVRLPGGGERELPLVARESLRFHENAASLADAVAERWTYDLIDREQPGRWDRLGLVVAFAQPVGYTHAWAYLLDHKPDWSQLTNVHAARDR